MSKILRFSIVLFVALVSLSLFVRPSVSGKLVYGFVPEEELTGEQQGLGQMTPEAFRAVETAARDLELHGKRIEDYSSIHVSNTVSSYHVVFSDLPLYSPAHDDRIPGSNGVALFRIDKKTYEVLGSAQ